MTSDSEELQAIAREVRKFAEHELAPNAVEWDQAKHFPVDVLRRAGDLGLGGICVGEDVGGSGLGRLEAVTIFEELARGDTAIAAYVSIHNMVVSMIDSAGSDSQRKRWVPTLASMEGLGSYCLTEPEAGSDAGALRTTARRDGDSYVLDGVKQFISGAGSSSVYVVRDHRVHRARGCGRTVLRCERTQDGLACAADPAGRA
jgi:alkylation response protein AidB-like acyl-CoA dehydrogenase